MSASYLLVSMRLAAKFLVLRHHSPRSQVSKFCTHGHEDAVSLLLATAGCIAADRGLARIVVMQDGREDVPFDFLSHVGRGLLPSLGRRLTTAFGHRAEPRNRRAGCWKMADLGHLTNYWDDGKVDARKEHWIGRLIFPREEGHQLALLEDRGSMRFLGDSVALPPLQSSDFDFINLNAQGSGDAELAYSQSLILLLRDIVPDQQVAASHDRHPEHFLFNLSQGQKPASNGTHRNLEEMDQADDLTWCDQS
ncbi:hypothetical protein CERZMDRAFT_88940 [Cercospora zeae-maydis SCOH1-5]|uniref:Uncharacterized protein n=1 Tax=Cercospora zeae-maydis SCOH1-5 TaxID=717836 RepID=A0A6A6F192_9PEZI|nr:hypothetical protein CERZMDRAFT_88940 [Cercospora zeae-maydis SCOH1-5]